MSGRDQSDNIAGRDLVGRDKIESSTHITINRLSPTGALTRLLERLQEQQRDDARAQEMIAELKRFTEPKEAIQVGLEQKLKDGGRDDLIEFALETKEEFAKKLAMNTFFESAQEIHVLILSRIYSVFNTQILPKIKDRADRAAVDEIIQACIIEPIVAELQETPFRYYDHHVQGMLFYLTGNCHIVWG